MPIKHNIYTRSEFTEIALDIDGDYIRKHNILEGISKLIDQLILKDESDLTINIKSFKSKLRHFHSQDIFLITSSFEVTDWTIDPLPKFKNKSSNKLIEEIWKENNNSE